MRVPLFLYRLYDAAVCAVAVLLILLALGITCAPIALGAEPALVGPDLTPAEVTALAAADPVALAAHDKRQAFQAAQEAGPWWQSVWVWAGGALVFVAGVAKFFAGPQGSALLTVLERLPLVGRYLRERDQAKTKHLLQTVAGIADWLKHDAEPAAAGSLKQRLRSAQDDDTKAAVAQAQALRKQAASPSVQAGAAV